MGKVTIMNAQETDNNNSQTEKTHMNNKINLLDFAVTESAGHPLEAIKLGPNETPILAFTADGVKSDVHYCNESEINGFVHCNGPDCLLCRTGRKADTRLFLPVYLPAAGYVGILPVPLSHRPFALLPQILNVLKAGKQMVMFITRDGAKYSVSTTELQKDVDAGEIAILQFQDEFEAGTIDITVIYPRIANKDLANVEEIARMMALKGIECR